MLATGCVYGKDPQVWRQLLHTVRKLCGSRTLVVMAHGNGAAPGVQQMRGAFYEAALRRFDAVALPPQELPKKFQGCSLHVMIKKSRKDRGADAQHDEQQDQKAGLSHTKKRPAQSETPEETATSSERSRRRISVH